MANPEADAGPGPAGGIDCRVLHDFLLVRGGAEKLVDTLAECLEAPLVVGFSQDQAGPWASDRAGRLTALGPSIASRLGRYLVTARRFAGLDPARLQARAVVYSGVLAPLAVHRQPGGLRVHYCHSPPRFLYDLKDYYRQQGGWTGRLALSLLDRWLRPRYEAAIAAMDVVVANSENVRQRLMRYLGRDAVVVPPPIDTNRFRWIEDAGYFLSTARLEDYKRVDLIIRAFRDMPDQRLVVASGGGQERALRRLAQGCANIRFTSWLPEAELAGWIGRCRAVIYLPLDEDFGMSPVEAMAAGKPVIGVAEGGLLETVVDGHTGFLLPPDPTPDELRQAVQHLTATQAASLRPACEARAREFSRERFCQRMRAVLDSGTGRGDVGLPSSAQPTLPPPCI